LPGHLRRDLSLLFLALEEGKLLWKGESKSHSTTFTLTAGA
jgi:hypothetical protein